MKITSEFIFPWDDFIFHQIHLVRSWIPFALWPVKVFSPEGGINLKKYLLKPVSHCELQLTWFSAFDLIFGEKKGVCDYIFLNLKEQYVIRIPGSAITDVYENDTKYYWDFGKWLLKSFYKQLSFLYGLVFSRNSKSISLQCFLRDVLLVFPLNTNPEFYFKFWWKNFF